MTALNTPVCDFGGKIKPFQLKGIDGKSYTVEDVRGINGTLVMFICNHCPFVQAIIGKIVRDAKALQTKGVGVIAIMSNDTANYPDDSFKNMQKFAQEHGFTFPYVIDETQEVAQNYGAVCTPDFFGYNAAGELQYRGRLDNAGMDNKPDAPRELLNAMIQVAETGAGPRDQNPSIGCSIKWKAESQAA